MSLFNKLKCWSLPCKEPTHMTWSKHPRVELTGPHSSSRVWFEKTSYTHMSIPLFFLPTASPMLSSPSSGFSSSVLLFLVFMVGLRLEPSMRTKHCFFIYVLSVPHSVTVYSVWYLHLYLRKQRWRQDMHHSIIIQILSWYKLSLNAQSSSVFILSFADCTNDVMLFSHHVSFTHTQLKVQYVRVGHVSKVTLNK